MTTEAVVQAAPIEAPAKTGGFNVWPLVIVLLIAALGAAAFVLWKKRRAVPVISDVGATEAGGDVGIGIRVGGAQTIGKRSDQEDSLCYSNWQNVAEYNERGLLAAVSDGIGGLEKSELASQTAMRNMRVRFLKQDPAVAPADRLLELTGAAQQDVLALNHALPQGSRVMGATLVSVLIQRNLLWLSSVGDSRIYLYRAGAMLPLNRPHVFGKENREDAVLTGGGRPSDARQDKKLTAYLGQENLRKVDRNVNPIKLMPSDRVLLMSDGVFGTVGEDEMVRSMGLSPDLAAKDIIRMVEAANKPHQDNATVVVIALD